MAYSYQDYHAQVAFTPHAVKRDKLVLLAE